MATAKKQRTITGWIGSQPSSDMKLLVDELKRHAKDIASLTSEWDSTQFVSVLQHLDDLYHNHTAALDDERYDQLVDLYQTRFKVLYAKIGAQPSLKHQVKVQLPVYMGSLDKKKTQQSLDAWCARHYPKAGYVISNKVDGLSCLLYFNRQQQCLQLFTRGDGNVGMDLTRLLPLLLHTIPDVSFEKHEIGALRGEIVLYQDRFDRINNCYGDGKMSNARNTVAGIVNAKTIDPRMVSELSILFYQVYDWKGGQISMQCRSPSLQFEQMRQLGFSVPTYTPVKRQLQIDSLTSMVLRAKREAGYEIDGIVIGLDEPYLTQDGKNPDHAIAFKIASESCEADVEYVEWSSSKDSLLKPRVKLLKPVKLSGVIITWCTGFNAKYIEDNKIGPGAQVLICRSGEVIPHIEAVLRPSRTGKADLPDQSEFGAWQWNATGVDIVLLEENSDVVVKQWHFFLDHLGAENMGLSTVEKLYTQLGQLGRPQTLKELLGLRVADLSAMAGVGDINANKWIASLQKCVKDVPLPTLMAASGVFGRGLGSRKLKSLLQHYPGLLKEWSATEDSSQRNRYVSKVMEVEGFAEKSAEAFVSRLEAFRLFLQTHPMISYSENVPVLRLNEGLDVPSSDPLPALIVFTGFRDADVQLKLEALGVKISSSVSKKTQLVVVKDDSVTNNKTDAAQSMGIPLLTLSSFRQQYGV